jgi:hypothetical protein
MNTNCSTPTLTPSEALAMAPAVALSVVRDCAVILGTYGLHDCEDELAQACKSLSAVVAENESLRAEMGRVRELPAKWRSVAHGLRVLSDDKAAEATNECAAELAEALNTTKESA